MNKHWCSWTVWGGRGDSGWPLFALGISCCSVKHFRNFPQSDPLAPAQLTRRAAIGSSRHQLSAWNCHRLSARPPCRRGDSPPACSPPHRAVTVKTTGASLHNGGSLDTESAVTWRWEMWRSGSIPVSQTSYWSEESRCLETVSLKQLFMALQRWHDAGADLPGRQRVAAAPL